MRVQIQFPKQPAQYSHNIGLTDIGKLDEITLLLPHKGGKGASILEFETPEEIAALGHLLLKLSKDT